MKKVLRARKINRKPTVLRCHRTSKKSADINKSFIPLLSSKSLDCSEEAEGLMDTYLVPDDLIDEYVHQYTPSKTTRYLEDDIRLHMRKFSDSPFLVSASNDGWEIAVDVDSIGRENVDAFWKEVDQACGEIINDLVDDVY